MNEPRTKRGEQTKAKLLAAAEAVFSEQGYQAASISRITERAKVAQGTFYLYFESKLDLFEQLVDDLNRRVRKAMSDGAARGANRAEAEREGFREFFAFTAEHPALYRVVREAEYVSPGAMRSHYERIVEGYREGLERARANGEIGDVDPEVAAWALMGVGEMIGMRYVLWPTAESGPYGSGATPVPDHVFDEMVAFVQRALGTAPPARAAAARAGRTPATASHPAATAAHTEEDA
ncbi:TetR/AcrR family transcriptional regulator [Agrococcus sp. SCSIO52902]|uniref:TetR/AcrR family transcriptional regulator n=1 Tax=Agrococcus sp. SCSIO52902 TaxID=2933290 RepID=UPI001FF3FF40|nr:TetR/AcrR family transcriptional regulator [Agrococcus sp. SCSIO52902]UOV99964.1 TetR/AcrR family transcriptional regulator [Agrococcus sp. SCSIO52902]